MLGDVVGLEMVFGCIQDGPEMGRVSFFTLAAYVYVNHPSLGVSCFCTPRTPFEDLLPCALRSSLHETK